MPVLIEGSNQPENVLGFFNKRGYDVISYNPATLDIIAKKDNKEEKFNLGKLVEKMGGKIVQADSLNSPENAQEESPASFMDRVKLSFSTQKDRPESAKKLKSTFTDAQMSKDGTLVVKENGLWKRIDPSGFDPGDLADITGYLLPTAGQVLGSTGGVSIGGFPGGVAGGTLGGAVGESARQGIGKLIGMTNNVDTGELATQSIQGGLTTPASMVTGALSKGVTTKVLPTVLSFTTGIPKDVIKFTINHPEVLEGKLQQIKLPSGEIYDLSKLAANQLNELKTVLGKNVSLVAQEVKYNFTNKDLKKEILKMYKSTVKEVWGGVKHMTGDERSILHEVLGMLKSSVKPKSEKIIGFRPQLSTSPNISEEPLESSFLKLHNIKQFIYDRLDWKEGMDTKGGIFLKKIADNINNKLTDTAEKLGSNYPQINNQYKELSSNLKGFGVATEDIAKKINTLLTKTYTGTISEPEKAMFSPLVKTANLSKSITSLSNKGIIDKTKNKLIKDASTSFESWNPNWAPLILSSILSGGNALTQGIGPAATSALGGASSILPLTIPKLVGTGISLSSKASNLIPQGVKNVLGSELMKNSLGLGGIKLGTNLYEGNI